MLNTTSASTETAMQGKCDPGRQLPDQPEGVVSHDRRIVGEATHEGEDQEQEDGIQCL
jgi:hypothetical protein